MPKTLDLDHVEDSVDLPEAQGPRVDPDCSLCRGLGLYIALTSITPCPACIQANRRNSHFEDEEEENGEQED